MQESGDSSSSNIILKQNRRNLPKEAGEHEAVGEDIHTFFVHFVVCLVRLRWGRLEMFWRLLLLPWLAG